HRAVDHRSDRERARPEIAGAVGAESAKPSSSPDRDGIAALDDPGAHGAQQPLGMVAALSRLAEAGLAVREQAREQYGALHLRAGDVGSDGASEQRMSAADDHRRLAETGLDLRAELAQRLGHALHRPARQRLIPRQRRLDSRSREYAGEQADRRAGVAAVEASDRLAKPAKALSEDDGVVFLHVRIVLRKRRAACRALRGNERRPRLFREFLGARLGCPGGAIPAEQWNAEL